MFNLSVDFKHFKRQIGFYKLYILDFVFYTCLYQTKHNQHVYISLQSFKLVIAFTMQNKTGWGVYRELILSLH